MVNLIKKSWNHYIRLGNSKLNDKAENAKIKLMNQFYINKRKLEESESKFRNLFENSPLEILILDRTATKPSYNFNKQFCNMLGYSLNELKAKSIKDIIVREHLSDHLHKYKLLKEGKIEGFNLKKKYLKKSGKEFWGNLNISVTRNEDGAILQEFIMVEDITKQKAQEEKIQKLINELKLLNEKLEQKVKLRTMDLHYSNAELLRSNHDLEQFAYIASHDLQEPLRMIGNFTQLLVRQYKHKFDEEGIEYVDFIVGGVSRMSRLIQNLLKYSRVGRKELALRKVDLGRVLESKLFGLKHKIENLNAKITIPQFPKKIYCEPEQIGMVFHNLISNALKFNKVKPLIDIGYEDKEKEALFFVQDNGIGIDQRFEKKVFDVFKRLHRREEYEGTGIGLALCKKIIVRHKGKIWFDSNLGKGTIFYFTISKQLENE